MNVNYRRDLNNNYMLLECKSESSENNYQLKMLAENDIPGFLPVKIQRIDNIRILYYEISSKQAVKTIFERREIKHEILSSFLFQMYQIIQKAEEYLLNPACIMLEPEFIYMNMETDKIFVSYYPEYEISSKESFRKLAEYFLDRIDYTDQDAVILAHNIYKFTRNANYRLEEILKVSMNTVEEKEEKDYYAEVVKKESETAYRAKKEESSTEEDDEKRQVECLNVNSGEEEISCEPKQTTDELYRKKQKTDKTKAICLKIVIVTFLCMAAIIYLKIENLLPQFITYKQFTILVGINAACLVGSVVKMLIDAAKKKMEKDTTYVWKKEEEEDKPFYNREEEILTEETEYEYKPDVSEEEEGIRIYDFLTNVNISNSMVAEEGSYGNQEETGYNGDTVLLGNMECRAERVLSGYIHGKQIDFLLKDFPVIIGKKAECVSYTIPDISISRIHAQFIESNGEVYLEDLNSTNGTFKNGVRLDANEVVMLEPEDEIAFGKIEFTYH